MLGSTEMLWAECEELLRVGNVGRVCLCTPTGPHIAPVAYAVVDDTVVFRISIYSVLGTHGRNATLAFHVDDFDRDARGWSVVATGRAEVVTSEELLARTREALPLLPSSAGMRHIVVRMPVQVLTGTRTDGSSAA